jgi:hypothetical protein
MGWHYDKDKVQEHLAEAKIFLDHAEHDDPASVSDMFGRPFREEAETRVAATRPQPVAPVQVNIYLLHAQQLLEANLITVNQYNEIVTQVGG